MMRRLFTRLLVVLFYLVTVGSGCGSVPTLKPEGGAGGSGGSGGSAGKGGEGAMLDPDGGTGAEKSALATSALRGPARLGGRSRPSPSRPPPQIWKTYAAEKASRVLRQNAAARSAKRAQRDRRGNGAIWGDLATERDAWALVGSCN